MTTSKSYKDKLISNLKDKKYRDAFVASHINNGIPFQIKTIREQREWSQEEFAQRAEKQQAAVSRLENPNYGSFTLATLKEIASTFDVGLIVRFVPISELVEWDINLSSESLQAVGFKKDPYFKEKDTDVAVTLDHAITPQLDTSSNKVINMEAYRLSRAIKPPTFQDAISATGS